MRLTLRNKKIIDELSERYNLSKDEILEVTNSPFKFIRAEIKTIDIDRNATEEEFEKQIKNFNIPSIGKLYGSYYNFKKVNNGRKDRT